MDEGRKRGHGRWSSLRPKTRLWISKKRYFLPRHPRVLGTLALAVAAMPPNAARLRQRAGARARVHRHRLADNEPVRDELANCLPRVGIADFVHLVRVEPDAALAAAHHGRSQAFLCTEIDPAITEKEKSSERRTSSICRFLEGKQKKKIENKQFFSLRKACNISAPPIGSLRDTQSRRRLELLKKKGKRQRKTWARRVFWDMHDH